MATKLYPAASLASEPPVNSQRVDPFGIGGFWEDFSGFWDGLNNHNDFHVSHFRTVKGFGIRNSTAASVTGPAKLVSTGLNISDPIATAITISGTVTFNIWAQEANMSANATLLVALMKLDRFGTLTLISEHSFGTELVIGVSTVCNWTAAPTSTDFEVGDHICAVIGFTDATSLTMGAGFNLTLSKAGTTDAADGDTWIQFTENISFIPEGRPGGTVLHLTDRDETGVGSGSMVPKLLSPTRDNAISSAVRDTVAGPLSAPLQWTEDTTSDVPIQWFSKPLRAFTLSGLIGLRLPHLVPGESFPYDSAVCVFGEFAICDNSGLNPVIWCSQVIGVPNLDDTGAGLETESAVNDTNALYGRIVYMCGPDVSVTDGQRFRVRAYICENWSDNSTCPMESGWTAQLNYGNPGGFKQSDGYVIFSQGVYELADTDHEVPAGYFHPELVPEMWFQMIILASTSDKIQLVTASAVAIDCHATYMDVLAGAVTALRNNEKPTTATTTDIVDPPAGSTSRSVKFLSIKNIHASSSNAITVQHTDGTNLVTLWAGTLLAGELLTFTEEKGFRLFDANGIQKANPLTIAGNMLPIRLGADLANATTAAAKVTGLDLALGVGTWMFDYRILYTSTVTTTGLKFGCNHTGAVTSFAYNGMMVTANITGADAIADQDVLLTTGGLISAWAARAKTTTAPMISAGVDTINVDMLLVIQGLVVVTVAGNLELYHASETANSTTVKAGSSLLAVKTA